jgi:hypothetical protein
MVRHHYLIRVVLVLLMLNSCGQRTPSQLQETATVLDCWPYDYPQPNPTKTMVVPPYPGLPGGELLSRAFTAL